MAWVLADGTKHMIQLNGSNQKRWPTAPARHGAAVPESISPYTEFNSARRIRLRVTPEIKPRAFFKPSIIRGYDADGTQRNDAEGGKQIRELRRFFAGKILGALPCVQDAPGLWIFPARMHIEHGPGASDTSASHTCRRSLQTHRRTRPGCYHSEESARISGIAMVITANEGGTLVAPKNRDLAHAA